MACIGLAGCTGKLGDDGDPGDVDPNGTMGADPGRVTLHRLNRAEYNNTVRDLLGTTQTPADDFPADDFGYGFDNVADVLSLSPTHIELYERAAEMLIDEALAATIDPELFFHEAEDVGGTAGNASGDAWNLSSNGEVAVTVTVPSDGQYRIATRVWGQQAGTEPARMALKIGGVAVGTYDVPNVDSDPLLVEETLDVSAGNQVLAVEFLNDFFDPNAGADRNLVVDWLSLEGPLGATAPNATRDKLLFCDLAADGCAQDVVRSFARRAWRRAVTDEEVDRLMLLVAEVDGQGDGVEAGVALALRAILTSHHFIFRVELDPDPSDTTPHPLNDWEVASRLSYFLWSSMPDDELLEAAEASALSDPEQLLAQVERMLADPKASAFPHNFAGQWLFTRSLGGHVPDYQIYPDWDDSLRAAMQQETELFFSEFLQNGRPVADMLIADFTYVDDRLATHYALTSGVPAPGAGFARVETAGSKRLGLLGHGSLLTVTSQPTRTSPVKRGKFILSQLLCSEPPPPPPGVEGLVEDTGMTVGSLRERLEQHRADPTCASCHDIIDPLGFGLENFDGIGAYRTEDAGFPIDASGELAGGGAFAGLDEMTSLLTEDPRFGRCIIEKVLTYGLGRGVESSDDAFVDYIEVEAGKQGFSLDKIVKLVAVSEPFRMRRGELPDEVAAGDPENDGGEP